MGLRITISICVSLILVMTVLLVRNIENRKIISGMLVAYIFSIVMITIVMRTANAQARISLNPINKYRSLIDGIIPRIRSDGLNGLYIGVRNYASTIFEILWNVLLFIPMGFLLPAVFGMNQKYMLMTILIGLTVSLVIEILQFTTRRGWFDISDIIHNLCGICIGYIVYSKVIRKKALKQPIEI